MRLVLPEVVLFAEHCKQMCKQHIVKYSYYGISYFDLYSVNYDTTIFAFNIQIIHAVCNNFIVHISIFQTYQLIKEIQHILLQLFFIMS